MSNSEKVPMYVQPQLNITVTVTITQGGHVICLSPIREPLIPYTYEGLIVWPYWPIADPAFRRAMDECIAQFESGYRDDVFLG